MNKPVTVGLGFRKELCHQRVAGIRCHETGSDCQGSENIHQGNQNEGQSLGFGAAQSQGTGQERKAAKETEDM